MLSDGDCLEVIFRCGLDLLCQVGTTAPVPSSVWLSRNGLCELYEKMIRNIDIITLWQNIVCVCVCLISASVSGLCCDKVSRDDDP